MLDLHHNLKPKNLFVMKNKLFILGLILSFGIAFTSCKNDNDDDPVTIIETENTIVTDNISENTTWTSDNVYELAGRITVLDGATLTIEPGTIIKGQAGTDANSTALLVARGAKLMAEGTVDKPIIFTSKVDEISPEDIEAGNFASPNLNPNIGGLWGGVIILGKAKISASASEVQIEGIPTSDTNGLYGGDDDEDDSGVLRYISIRHGGTLIGPGNEINGLTLGGVGSGTTVDNIEIVSNADDGIEWFGGTVNVTNVVTWNVQDDGLDTDQAWGGTLTNFAVITPAGHCFELDGPEGDVSINPDGHSFINGAVYAYSEVDELESGDLINVDDNSAVSLENITFHAVTEGQQINKVTAAKVLFTGIQINVSAADLVNHVNGNVPAGVTAGNNSQADLSVFGWTWAHAAGKI
jgi:hypothetical protein